MQRPDGCTYPPIERIRRGASRLYLSWGPILRRTAYIALLLLLAAVLTATCMSQADIDAAKKPRYEAGAQRGAKVCAE